MTAGNEREFRGPGYLVCILPVFREAVSVIYTRDETDLKFSAELVVVKGHTGIALVLPSSMEPARAISIARDLETAFGSMGYEYLIRRDAGTDAVPEAERQDALRELGQLGIAADALVDGKVRLIRAGAPGHIAEMRGEQAARVLSLLRDVHGQRQRWEVLAKSKEF